MWHINRTNKNIGKGGGMKRRKERREGKRVRAKKWGGKDG